VSQPPNPTSSGRPPARQANLVDFKSALRKAKRKNQREPEIDFLNITAMLDLMTIVLVFVLKSLATSTTSIPQNADLQLPMSVLTVEPGEEGVLIRISKTQISVGDEEEPIVEYSDARQLGQTGLDARHKGNGPNDLYINPLALVLQKYRENDRQMRRPPRRSSSPTRTRRTASSSRCCTRQGSASSASTTC
jgi:biopolymer transport protein ExbD